MAVRTQLVFGLLLLAGFVSATDVSPMDKVFQLMDELTVKIKKEGDTEEKAFKEFFEWCDDAAANTHNSIKTATKEKESLQATIEKAKADSETAETNIEELAAAITTAESDLKAATEIRAKEAADFASVEDELIDGVSSLDRAVGKVQAMGSSFIQQKVDSSSTKALLQTLDVVISKAGINAADKPKLVAMVQTQQSDSDWDMDAEMGAPAAASYGSQSGGILDILEDMKDKAETELKDARKAEQKAKHEFELLKQGLEDQLAADKKELKDTKANKAEADQTNAVASGDLAETMEELRSLNANLDTVSTDCMTSATDHENSKKARAEELAVIAKAKQIIEDSVGGATSRQYGFLQVSANSKSQSQAKVEVVNMEVVAAVKKLARQQHSAALAQLASRISAVARFGGRNTEDIFAKIKGLIGDMIAKLQKEAAEEATKKAYCDEETAKTKAKKEDLEADIDALKAKIDKAVAASAGLKEDVATLQKELAALAATQAEMDKARADENAAYKAAKTDLEAGINGVQGALEVLRNYYGSASLLQDPSVSMDSLMQQPAPPAGHSKASGAGGSIIGILEVCESDFSKSLAQEEMTESTAQSEYDKVTQENKITKATKDQDVKYKTKEAKGLDKSIAEWSSDKEGFSTELSAVLEYKEKIDSQCIAKAESYEERKAAREAEIDGLKEALKILESEGVFLQKPRNLRLVAEH